MKVLHVIWSATIGGIERVVMDLINRQNKNPHLEVSLLIGKTEGELLPSFASLHIEVYTLGLKSGNEFSISKYQKAKKIFSEQDIIHIHSFNPLICRAAKSSGKKIIYTEHGNFGIGKQKTWRDKIVKHLQKQFLNNSVDQLLFNSHFSQKQSELLYGLTNVKRKVIYNGIPLKQEMLQAPADLKTMLDGTFVVGTIARLAGVKRIDRLLKSYALFSEGKNCKLLLIGDGPLMSELKALAEKLGIIGSTLFAGYRKDARSCLQLMNVCAFPSEKEAFGLVAIEAWDAGKPVVVFNDAGGLAELVNAMDKNDITSNESEFAERLNYYYYHPSTTVDVERRKEFAGRFSIEKMENEIYSVYSDVRN